MSGTTRVTAPPARTTGSAATRPTSGSSASARRASPRVSEGGEAKFSNVSHHASRNIWGDQVKSCAHVIEQKSFLLVENP